MPDTKKLWSCKIGEIDAALLPDGADAPLRRAVREAYYQLTGVEPQFVFSGWGDKLTETERVVAEELAADD